MDATLNAAVAAQYLRVGDVFELCGEWVTVQAAYRYENETMVMVDSVTIDGISETTHMPFGRFVRLP